MRNDDSDDTVSGGLRAGELSRRRFGALTFGAGVVAALTTAGNAADAETAAKSSVVSRNVLSHRKIIERGFNQGDLTVADEICAPKYIEHEDGIPPGLTGPEILKSQIRATRGALQNVALTIEDFVEGGDKVWARITFRGRDARSGKDVSVTVMDISRFDHHGKLVEHWGVVDQVAMFRQLGVLPKELGG